MSYLKIQTNKAVRKKTGREILKTASELVAMELGKPKELIMVALQPDTEMLFGGSDAPVAFLELKSVGIPKRKMKSLYRALSALIKVHLNIPDNRVYVKMIDVPHGMWGWKGGGASS